MTSSRTTLLRPRLRRLAIIVLILLLPFASWTAWEFVEARRLARAVDAIRARNEPVTAYRQVPFGGPNAARYYDAAAALVDTVDLQTTGGPLHRLEFRRENDRAALAVDIRGWLEKNVEAEALLAKATVLEFQGYPPSTQYTYRMDRALRLALLGDLRALERIEAQDPGGAVAGVARQLGVVRAIRAVDRDGGVQYGAMQVGRAATHVGRILGMAPSPEALADLDHALADLDRDDVIEQTVLEARALVLGRYWDSGRRWFTNPGMTSGPIAPVVWSGIRPYVVHAVTNQVALMAEFLETSRKPWPDRLDVGHQDVRDYHASFAGLRNYVAALHGYAGTVMAHRRLTWGAGRTLAWARAARAAIAVEHYRRAHAGALPDRLSDLVPAQLAAVPVDPFSGKEILFRTLPDGYSVYSIGANRRDDGGEEVEMDLHRRAMMNDEGEEKDLGVRVTLPQHPAR